MTSHKITDFYTEWFSVCPNITSTSQHLKVSSKKTMIQIKFVDMSTIFYCTEFHSSKCNISQVVSIKQNTNFNFQAPPCSYFWVFAKIILLIVVQPLKFYQHTKFHGPTFDWCKFVIHLISLNIHHFGMVEAKSLKHILWHTSLLDSIKIYKLVSKL
jgi:hypothetical protein